MFHGKRAEIMEPPYAEVVVAPLGRRSHHAVMEGVRHHKRLRLWKNTVDEPRMSGRVSGRRLSEEDMSELKEFAINCGYQPRSMQVSIYDTWATNSSLKRICQN
jgi:hypothetical protein